ncbi:MAG TPA: phage BR0599 family protein, partial [Propionibacteriaceae bacterium]|nr:phage BR0599 family protein [Propionibacteriaceae bacterium]
MTEVTGTGASALAVLCFGRGVAVVAAGTGFFVAVEGVGTTLGVVLGGSLGNGVLSGDGVVAEGDGFIARAGCDKRTATCSTKFANVANFRGFPNIPGQDAVLRYASQDG